MAVFVNTHYRERAAIVTIVPKGDKLTAKDFHRDVRNHFNIQDYCIKFYDYKTTAAIPDAILPAYVDQFRASAGWFLGAVAVTDDDEDEDLHHCHNHIRRIMNVEILKNLHDLDYKMIWANYKNNNFLENKQQIKLGKIVIKAILEEDLNIEFSRRDFIYLSDIICQVFVGELKEVYYSKAENGQKASGKLYDAHANYRRLLSLSGLLKRRTYSGTEKKPAPADGEMKDVNTTLDHEFVKTNIKTSAEFLERWTNCLPERSKLIKDSKLSIGGLEDYLKLYPVIEVHKKYLFDLCLADVKTLYPHFKGFENFDHMYENILKKGAQLKNTVVQKWVTAANHCCKYTRKALALMLLPYFFPSTQVKGRALKRAYKPSKVKVQEKFVLYYETMQRADVLKQHKTELNTTTQPIIVFVGANETLTSHVTFMGNTYDFENPLEAVQSCLALYLALYIPYPTESAIVWTYVQKYVFGVSTPNDSNSSSVKAVHQQLTSSPQSD